MQFSTASQLSSEPNSFPDVLLAKSHYHSHVFSCVWCFDLYKSIFINSIRLSSLMYAQQVYVFFCHVSFVTNDQALTGCVTLSRNAPSGPHSGVR